MEPYLPANDHEVASEGMQLGIIVVEIEAASAQAPIHPLGLPWAVTSTARLARVTAT